ncbi:hypothetical protein [Enterococcus faecalis]|uniref:hypothetical protein n=1 Tax=Enterococcus faecalis TaxID=1351 RepID=UPI003D9FED3A
MNRISNLFEILNGAIVLWSNELERALKKVDDLFFDVVAETVREEALKITRMKQFLNQTAFEQLASDAEELDKLGVSYAYVEKITHKVKLVAKAVKFIYEMPQDTLVREISIASTKQEE